MRQGSQCKDTLVGSGKQLTDDDPTESIVLLLEHDSREIKCSEW
jgi:hypothetical protein